MRRKNEKSDIFYFLLEQYRKQGRRSEQTPDMYGDLKCINWEKI